MPHRTRWIALGALGAALLATPVWAQGTAPTLAVTPTQAMAAAALLDVPDTSSETLAAATFGLDAVQSGRREGTILMIVGGAAFVIGLIAEEEVVWIPGLAVGLFGLYRYLKSGGDI
jgi:hypothetical protein